MCSENAIRIAIALGALSAITNRGHGLGQHPEPKTNSCISNPQPATCFTTCVLYLQSFVYMHAFKKTLTNFYNQFSTCESSALGLPSAHYSQTVLKHHAHPRWYLPPLCQTCNSCIIPSRHSQCIAHHLVTIPNQHFDSTLLAQKNKQTKSINN